MFNLVQQHCLQKKIFDLKKNYLGCKSLGREREFYMEKGKVMCRGEQVKIYHFAKGGRTSQIAIRQNGIVA